MKKISRKLAGYLITDIKSKKPDYLKMEECHVVDAKFSSKDITLTITFGWDINSSKHRKRKKEKT
jgi:hypothetical protein